MAETSGIGSTLWDFAQSPTGGAVIGAAAGAGLSALTGGQGSTSAIPTGFKTEGSAGHDFNSGSSSSFTGLADYMRPYTTGDQGIYPLAQQQYLDAMKQGYIGQTPGQQGINTGIANTLQQYLNPSQVAGDTQQANTFADRYKSNLQGVDPNVQNSMNQFLGGAIDTRGLDALQQAATNRAMVGYGDSLQDAGNMFTQQIAPAIRSGAMLSGQYGGSRQGVAEGVSAGLIGQQLGRNARDLSLGSMDVGTQLYSDAYQQARDNQYGMTEFGAAFGIDQNEQAMRNIYQNAGMEQQGLGMRDQAINRYLGGQQGTWDAFERNQMDARGEQEFGWDQLANYFNFINGQGQETRMSESHSGGGSDSSWGRGVTGTAVPGEGYGLLEGMGAGATIGQGIGEILEERREV